MSVPAFASSPACPACGISMDSQYFDVFGFANLPAVGNEALLAEFQMPPQYCGILESFSQYTDRFFSSPADVQTKGLEWRLLVNGRPLHPYTKIEAIVNPWGVGSYPVRIRLPEGARLQFSVRMNPGGPDLHIASVGGRITGRYWFPDG